MSSSSSSSSSLSSSSSSQKPPSLSPFAECVVLATLHGRCMTYRRSYTTKESHGGGGGGGGSMDMGEASGGDDFWNRQRWLASAVERRLQTLEGAGSVHVGNDPMLFLVHMLAHSAVIKLCHMVQGAVSSASHTVEQLHAAAAFEQEASSAAAEMVRLAKQIPSFGYFKAHPFLPDLLACAASYLTSRSGNAAFSRDGGAQQLLRVLGDMEGINILARGYFQGLRLDT
ncbi:hypothetical protein M406DRAFT_355858 [Cryphonectria parasitica EP155]|uniref:Uncharacterized protein n=1 Tax=Cryphonectria parasitica (strain ATCC 38755 / EP155) TaxID=660469 RepID=A0A9P4Y2Q5_CRYP1|nr:uncharacterized protein M406DRAFT_355858 [Cryphonectria parasitica EP155]KAF3765282.1 hypothetical protein M406DRAFT_355858 [Cryphonectria parasitica EP155]